MEIRRGQVFGCGMATIGLGEGVVDLDGVVTELQHIGFSGDTTLEVAGAEAVARSCDYLIARGGKL